MPVLLEISTADCQAIIAKKLNNESLKVVSFKYSELEEDNGYLGIHSKLSVDVEDSHGGRTTEAFFVKSLPQDQNQIEFLQAFKGDVKERNFYLRYCQELARNSINLLDDVLPACYLCTKDNIFFEDLTVAGYQTLSSRQYHPVDIAKTALKAIAKFHASGLVLEETTGNLRERFGEDLNEIFFVDTPFHNTGLSRLTRGMDAIIDNLDSPPSRVSGEALKGKIRDDFKRQKTMEKVSQRFRNTVCHGDLWTKNLMFRFEGKKVVSCMLVDLQTYHYAPPAQDVMFLLMVILSEETRRGHMEELLRYYHRLLSLNTRSYGFGELISWEEFVESCRFYIRVAFLMRLCNFQIALLQPELVDDLQSGQNPVNNEEFIENHYRFTIEVCRRDPVFKKISVDLVSELRGYYEGTLTGFLYSNNKN